VPWTDMRSPAVGLLRVNVCSKLKELKMVCTQGGTGMRSSSRCWPWLLLLALAVSGPRVANAQKSESAPSSQPPVASSPAGASDADEAPSSGDEKASEKAAAIKGRLPNQYGKLGISSEQRKRIYAIQSELRTEVMRLEQQIEKLRREEQQRVEAVLSVEQLALLKQLRSAAQERLNSRKSTSRN
jgi:hypothetical protein